MPPELTTTSYAILGLLAIRPWTTYELARQMERSFRNFWPRAESRIYEEPKRLAALGLADATAEPVGRRPRTVYSITDEGRRALARWVAEPGGGPQLEFESLLKIFFAEHASREATLARVEEIRAWSQAKLAEHVAVASAILDTGGPFPDRAPQLVLVGRFLADFAAAVDVWAQWAREVVAAWPDDVTDRQPDLAALTEIAAGRVGASPPPVGRPTQ